MNPDDEAVLLLYLYGELDADERAVLEARLSGDPLLRHQLAELRRDLSQVEQVLHLPEPDSGFEDRLWRKLEPKLHMLNADQAASPVLRSTPDLHGRRRVQFRSRVHVYSAWAATVVLALSLGLWLGARHGAATLDGDKVLAAQLSAHLRTTEQVFLLAQHEPQSGALAGELARGLMDSHRVYAAAAERAGRPQLAHALREMEPVLLELATAPEHTVDALLQQAITDADLPFKARSAAWAVQQTQSPAPRPRG